MEGDEKGREGRGSKRMEGEGRKKTLLVEQAYYLLEGCSGYKVKFINNVI